MTNTLKRKRHFAFALAVILGIGATSEAAAIAASGDVYGVVVECVEANSAAEKAGIQKGDTLLRWSGGGNGGEILSPLDLLAIEEEWSPRTAINLYGLRKGKTRTWALRQENWGMTARPQLPEALATSYRSPSRSSYRSAEQLAKTGRIAQAAALWNKAAVYNENSHPALAAWFEFRAATLLSLPGSGARRWKQADEAYARAVRDASGSESAVRVQLLQAWAASYMQRGDFAQAEKKYEQAIAESSLLGEDSLTLAANMDNLGMLFWKRGDLTRAGEYCRRALAIRTKVAPNSLALAQSLDSVGAVVRYPRGSGLTEAEDYFRRALAIQTSLAPGGLDMASSLNSLGIVAWQRGELAQAEDYLKRALDIAERLRPGGLEAAFSWNELGTVADLQGDPAKSKSRYTKSLAIRRKLAPRSWELSQSVHNLGLLAQEQGDAAKGEYFTRQALEIDIELGGPESLDVAGDYNDLCYLAEDRGNLEEAEKYGIRALAVEENIADDGLYLAETLNSLGELSRRRADWSAAENYYRQALAIREKLAFGSADHAATLAGLASVMRSQGQMDAAQGLYEEALNALESQTARLGGSEEIRSGFRATHAGYYKEYVDLLLDRNRPELALQALERSRARMLLEMMTAAHVEIREGADAQLLERERRLQSDLTGQLAGRIRLLSAPHSEEQLSAIQKEIEETLAAHRQVEEQIRSSNPRYAALVQPEALSAKEIQQQLLDPETLLLEYSLGEERSHVFLISQNSLTSYSLPKRSEIEMLARSVYGLLTEPNRVIKDESEAARKIRLARASQRYERAVTTLSQMIVGPFAGELGKKRLLIVSDGALQYIPFGILPCIGTMAQGHGLFSRRSLRESSPRGSSPRESLSRKSLPQPDQPRLVDEHEIVNLPSASVLAVLRREEVNRGKGSKSVAVLADPVFDSADPRVEAFAGNRGSRPQAGDAAKRQSAFWSSLPASRLLRSASDVTSDINSNGGSNINSNSAAERQSREIQELHLNRLWFTRLEADTIVASAGRDQAMEAVDFKASRSAATSRELAQYRIVHFATHGLLDSRNPELSGLVFSMVDAKGRPQNGFLDLQDIYNLELPVEMVVLSACETGLGKEVDGEGLVGLTRGFMYAGASRVVASLWRVSDVATAKLMGLFYKAMQRDGMPAAAALRTAQIEMRRQKRWDAPYYWAGFQIQGEWR
ncbi:MAG: CHAT domain-containing protein [Candidatus Sulfotelmatobacter sp.]